MEYKAKILYLLGKPVMNCYCIYCENEYISIMYDLYPDEWHFRSFIVCNECGNKRCPKATYHDHECTKSNDPGQHNSSYGDFILRDDE